MSDGPSTRQVVRISLSVAATALALYLIYLLRGVTPKLESEARKLPGRLSSIAKELSAVTVGAFSATCHGSGPPTAGRLPTGCAGWRCHAR